MGKEHLLKAEDLTSQQLHDRAVKGGIASAKARKEKKTLKMELEALLEIADERGDDVQKKMCFALLKKACKGDVKAFETVRDTIGQSPIKILDVNVDKNREEAQELLANIKSTVQGNDVKNAN